MSSELALGEVLQANIYVQISFNRLFLITILIYLFSN